MCVCVCVRMCVCVYIYIYIHIIEKLNRLSYGYYKFISAGHAIQETNLNRAKKILIRNNKNIFSKRKI